jgi:outer membrane murein-binding lipoprotein Lpp
VTTSDSSAPRRRAAISPLRRLSRNVLVIGTVVAVIAAFGPVWAVRFGVLVAVAAAVVSCVTAWREVTEVRHQHAAEMLAASRSHGAALTAERTQNAAVVDTLTGRVTAAGVEIRGQQAKIVELTSSIVGLTSTIGSLRAEISALRSDHAAARTEIRKRESEIETLRQTVRSREAELMALSEANGQVRAIPRRVLAEHHSAWQDLPEVDELTAAASGPSVSELVDVSVVLPNYEGDRRLA